MAVITPTITTDDVHEYRRDMNAIAAFAEGVHIDFSDGVFAPSAMVSVDDAWREDTLITHAHVMCQKPLEYVDAIIKLQPDLLIVHTESDNFVDALQELQKKGVRCGVAILPDTPVTVLDTVDDTLFDHVLVFGGHLGYQGGSADLSQLDKVRQLKERYPDVEIGWDGGANADNVAQIAQAGVDVINVGGAIKKADDPQKAYDALVSLVS